MMGVFCETLNNRALRHGSRSKKGRLGTGQDIKAVIYSDKYLNWTYVSAPPPSGVNNTARICYLSIMDKH